MFTRAFMKLVLGVLLQAGVYACVWFIPDMNGVLGVILIVVALGIAGFLSAWFWGILGVVGNFLCALMTLVGYVIYFHDKEALWAIGLITIPAVHLVEILTWTVTIMFRQLKPEFVLGQSR
jgi:hypothetical protein